MWLAIVSSLATYVLAIIAVFIGPYRTVNLRPISQVLSSQVTNTSITSSEAVVLTLRYSNVSSFMHVYNYTDYST